MLHQRNFEKNDNQVASQLFETSCLAGRSPEAEKVMIGYINKRETNILFLELMVKYAAQVGISIVFSCRSIIT